MTNPTNWLDENTRYLSAAVAAVRGRLERYGQPEAPPGEAPEPPKESRPMWRLFGRRQIAAAPALDLSGSPAALPPPSAAGHGPSDAEFVTDSGGPSPALVTLTQRLNLTSFERDILVLCAAMELDTGVAAMCARAQDSARPYPTFALALAALENPAWEALSPDRPLRYWRLIEITQPGGQSLTTSALRADERIVNYLKGLNYLDDRLSSLLWPFQSPDRTGLPDRQRQAEDSIVKRLKQSRRGQKLPLVHLIGRDGPAKRMMAASVAAQLGVRLFRMQMNMLPSQASDMEAFSRLWHRESLLLPAALYVDGDTGEGDSAHVRALQNMLAHMNALVFLETEDLLPDLGGPAIVYEVQRPPAAEQRAAWAAAIGEPAGDIPGLLAGQFDLSLPTIREITRQALADTPPSLRDALWSGALAATRPRLDALASRIEAKACWDDIVLPSAEMTLLRQIAAQVNTRTTVYDDWGFRDKSARGLGITALFTGPSGTGKTLAAEILAAELKLSLHRIDLATVVSKYIGETEKNLKRLFDAAEDGGTVLFFDEADALFGKRSEVKDSHDRYANIEINYLLQRMEAYRGLAILATNMKSALDEAFVRRLRFIVTFPFPAAADRKLIWQKIFPMRVPVGKLDFDRLARLNITGGNVRNIAMNAAFLAARDGTQVTMTLVLEAARTEFRKLDRPIVESDFRWSGAA